MKVDLNIITIKEVSVVQETLYGIGEMASISNISIQTLRYYDKIDLFKPAYVDPQTNYRYYRDSQLYQLDLIKSLKYVGTSLEDIKQALQLNTDELFHFLDGRSDAIQKQITHLSDIQANVEHVKKRMVNQLNNSIFGEVVFRFEEEMRILQSKARDISPLGILNISYSALKRVVETEEGVMQNGYGAIIPFMDYESIQAINYTHIFTPILLDKQARTLPPEMEVAMIPAGHYVCITFIFREDTYFSHYQKLVNYIKEQQIDVSGPVYEIFVPQHYSPDNEEEYIVEMKIKVSHENGSQL